MIEKDKNYKKKSIFGYILIVLGIIFILKLLNLITFRFSAGFFIGSFFKYFWPLFILVPGLALHASFFKGKTKDPGILIPGGIFLGVGLTCQLGMLFNIWTIVWPGFIFSVAIGLFEFYVYGRRNKGILIPVGIISVFSFLFFLNGILNWISDSIFRQLVFAAMFIIAGIMFIIKK
jgi:hypothetical protein